MTNLVKVDPPPNTSFVPPPHYHIPLTEVIDHSDLSSFPSSLQVAFSRAIHRSHVRQDLKKYQSVTDLPGKIGQLLFHDFEIPSAKQLGDLMV
jgi:hypothetical protein